VPKPEHLSGADALIAFIRNEPNKHFREYEP
jgi:hypothetical protein